MISGYKEIKGSIKEFFEDFRKNPGIVISCIVLGIGLGIAIDRFVLSSNEKNQASIMESSIIQTNQPNSKIESQSCGGGMFIEKSNDWQTASFGQPDEDGFYCLRSTKKFLYSNIWYKNPILTNFDSIELRYKLKNKDNSITKAPSFILSISQWEGPDILHLYIPEENYQIVGFEKNIKNATNTGFSMKREEVQYLDDPVEYGSEAELTAKIRIIEGNKTRFDFNLEYISALSGKSISNGFSYEVTLPFPSPESELSKLRIGLGTYQKSCLKPISYKFCY